MDKENRSRALKILCIALTAVFCLVLCALLISYTFRQDKKMSEAENRMLEQKPKLTLSAVFDGSYMKKFESWLSDQFPFRDKVISFKTLVDRAAGQKEENGVYFGKNSFLFEKQSDYDEARMDAITAAVNQFTKKHSSYQSAFILSPNASCVLSELLPDYAVQESQEEQLSAIKKKLDKDTVQWIDCYDIFSSAENREELFYRTDHHWTTQAAYQVFGALQKAWELDGKIGYEFHTVSDSFQGTLASAAAVSTISDTVEICTPKIKDLATVVEIEASGKKMSSLFDSAKLESKNHYEVFLGGNYDKVIISTNIDTTDALLVIKDSYANCMLPMLTAHFSKIVVIDPRYFSGRLSEVLQEYDFTHLLFVYNLNTLSEDSSLADALAS